MRGRRGTPELDTRALLGTARLLTGSDAAATDLLVRALARRPGTQEQARAALVRVHLRRWSRGPGSIDADPRPGAGAWWLSPADLAAAARLTEALHLLSPAQRTVLVLTHHDGLPPAEVAALVPGAPGLLAAAETAVAGEVSVAELPDRLEGLVGSGVVGSGVVGLGPAGEDPGARVREWRSTRRRRWATAVTAAAVLVAGSVLVPSDLDLRAGPSTTPATPTLRPAEPPPAVDSGTTVVLGADGEVVQPGTGPDLDALFGPATRGSLAGDQAFLDGLVARVAGGYDVFGGEQPHRVLFAGDVGEQRIGVVVAPDPYGTTVWVASGPAGSPVELLGDSVGMGLSALGASVGVVVGEPEVLLVFGRPGDAVAWSPGVVVDESGAATREWTDLAETDGATVVPVPADALSTLSYRVVREGAVLETAQPAVLTSGSSYELPPAPPETPVPLRPGRATAAPQAFQAAVLDLTWGTRLPADQLDLGVLWAGRMPTPEGGVADVAVVTAVLPNGALLTTTGYSWLVDGAGGSSSGGSGSCGTAGHPAGTDPATLTVAARCDLWDASGDGQLSTLVLTAPPGTATATLGAVDGGPTVPVRLTRGYTVVREVDPGLTLVTAPVPTPVTQAYPGFFQV